MGKAVVIIVVIMIIAIIIIGLLYYFNVIKLPETTESSSPSSPSPSPSPSWTKLGNGSCVTQGNEYAKVMYSHNPPYFVTTLDNCKTACESNAAESVKTEICTGINFYNFGKDDTGQCSQMARSPWVSPLKNIDTHECFYYGSDKPNGTAELKITPDTVII
jgi:hypothetical protein